MKLTLEQEKILADIRKVWEAMPDLRFLQLIGNCFGRVSSSDIYFVDDSAFQGGLLTSYHYIFPDKSQKTP